VSRSGALLSAGSGGAAGRAWQANTAYKAGDVVVQGGLLYTANADFTSGATFNATNWTVGAVSTVNGQAGAVSIPVLTTVATKSADYTANAGEEVPVDASTGIRTITLPASPASGAVVRVRRVDAGYATFNVVKVAGGPLADETLQPGTYIDFTYDGTAWRRTPGVSPVFLMAPLGFQNADPQTDLASLFQRPESRLTHAWSFPMLTFTSATDFDESVLGTGTITADADPYHPAGSPMITSGAVNVETTLTKFIASPVDVTNQILRIPVKVGASVDLRFASDRRGFVKGNYHRLAFITTLDSSKLPSGGWFLRGASLSQLIAVGTGADLTQIGAVQISVKSSAGANAGVLSLGPWMKLTPAQSPKAKCVFWFDDNYAGDWSIVLAMFERYGWKGVLAANIAQSDGNTPEQLRRMNKYGWQIGSHAPTNAEHTGLAGMQLRQVFAKSRHNALAIGVTGSEDWAWWGGLLLTPDSLKAVDQFFRSGRFNQSAARFVETLPPVNPQATQAWLQADGEALSGPQAYVDQAIAAKGLAQFVLHNPANVPTQTWLQGMLDYLDARRDVIDVVTIDEVWAPYLANTPPPASPFTVPSAPASIATQDVNGGEAIHWTQPTSSGGARIIAYAIQRRPAGSGSYATVGTVRTSDMVQSALTFTDTTAAIGTAYDYRVLARNRAGDSAPSPVATVTPAAVARPGTAPASAIAPAGWWVPDDSAAAGGAEITSIPDRSTGAHAMAKVFTTGPTKLAAALAGRSVAHSLSASQNGMKGAVPTKAEDVTVLLVAKPLALVGSGTSANYLATSVATNSVGTGDFGMQYTTLGDVQVGPARGTGASMVPGLKRVALNAWAVMSGSIDSNANSHLSKVGVNGEARSDTPTAFTANAATANFGVGGVTQGTGIDMDWAEAIVFQGALSDADRKAWEQYLGKTWGLPVYPF
jgi:hypothetical protein